MMFAFGLVVGLYVGGGIVEAATEYISVPTSTPKDLVKAAALWPMSLGLSLYAVFTAVR